MTQLLVVISGLPGSGKTTLARGLAAMLNLTVIDKASAMPAGAGD